LPLPRQYDPAPQDGVNIARGGIHFRLLFAQAFQGFLLTFQRLPGFVGILPQFPLGTAQLFSVKPASLSASR
jgi:hypothetical protein